MQNPCCHVFAAALLAVIGAAAAANEVRPAAPVIPARSFLLTDFAAVADGKTSNTAAFGRAVAAAEKAGGGTLVVPAGIYFTGPVELCSGLNLHLDAGATILFSPDPADYRTGPAKYRTLLFTRDAHDVMISGAGTIDGNGEAWWGEARRYKAEARAHGSNKDTSPRPNLIGFDHCQRVRLEGITITHSPKFNVVPNRCTDLTCDGLTIFNPADSPNTDGIDPSVSQRILITGCKIDTGDDNIAVKAGARNGDAVTDLVVEHCTFLHGHGCSIGSETGAGVRNMTVRDCTFDGTDIGVRFKSDRSRGGTVENVTYENLTMKNVGQAIVITSYYVGLPKPGQHDGAQRITASTPVWRNLTIRNLTATACSRNAGLIIGLPEMPASAITLENVRIEAPAGLRIGYARDVTLHHVKITAAAGEALLIEDTAENLRREN